MKPYNTLSASETKLSDLFKKVALKRVYDCEVIIDRQPGESNLVFELFDHVCFETPYLGSSASDAARNLLAYFDIPKNEYTIELERAAKKYDASKLPKIKLPKIKTVAFPVGRKLRGTFPAVSISISDNKLNGIIELHRIGTRVVIASCDGEICSLANFKPDWIVGFIPEYPAPAPAPVKAQDAIEANQVEFDFA